MHAKRKYPPPNRKPAKAEDVRICNICGKMILGEYDYVRAKRGTELYFHKSMRCGKEKVMIWEK